MAGATDETQHMLMSLVWDKDRLVTMMTADPYVCGYIIGRTLGVATGWAHRNSLPESDAGDIWFQATQAFFGDRRAAVMAIAKAYKDDETSKDQFSAGSRDVGLLALYMTGRADIRNHPEFQSIFDVLRKAKPTVQFNNPYFALAFEGIRFSRYLREHFPAFGSAHGADG